MKGKNIEITLPARYRYSKDTRTDKEKMLSDNIARSLSELNLERMRKKQSEPEPYQYSEKYFFVCITGLPPNPNQFGNLQLPGEKVDYSVTGFAGSYTHEQYMKIVSEISIESEAKNISQIVNGVPSDRKVVILFHSFAAFIVSTYFHLYDHSRTFAFIDIGGVSVTIIGYMLCFFMYIFSHNITQFKKTKSAYSKFYGFEVKNVQERFILNFEQGKHSLHHQPKVAQDINSAIKQYLAVLDLANKSEDSKL